MWIVIVNQKSAPDTLVGPFDSECSAEDWGSKTTRQPNPRPWRTKELIDPSDYETNQTNANP